MMNWISCDIILRIVLFYLKIVHLKIDKTVHCPFHYNSSENCKIERTSKAETGVFCLTVKVEVLHIMIHDSLTDGLESPSSHLWISFQTKNRTGHNPMSICSQMEYIRKKRLSLLILEQKCCCQKMCARKVWTCAQYALSNERSQRNIYDLGRFLFNKYCFPNELA